MTKQKRHFIAFLIAILLVTYVGCFNLGNQKVMAASTETEIEGSAKMNASYNAQINPQGLFTSLSLSIKGENSRIKVTAKNDITIFSSTVYVIVELYCSLEYHEKFEDMTLVAISSTMDLDMGQTIVAEASTGGVEQYWQGRMRYQIDSKAWEERNTGTVKYSATGEPLGIL